MRYAGSSHPEWGYLAPQPSVLRTARLMAVAAAIGAIAGSGVVLALVDRPAAETSVAARTLVRPAPASTANAAAAVAGPATNPGVDAHVGGQNHAQRQQSTTAGNALAASEAPRERTEQRSRGISTLAEAPAAAAAPSATARELIPARPAASSAATAETAAMPKKTVKKARSAPSYAWRDRQQNSGNGEAPWLHGVYDRAPDSEYSANDGYRGFVRDGGWGGFHRNEW